MRRPIASIAALTVLTAVAGCQIPTSLLTKGGDVKTAVQVAAGTILAGMVKVPAGIIAAGGGNLGGRELMALSEAPLANAEVFLADAAGNPIPGLAPVTTDDKGQYKFPSVPDGYTFMIVAKAKTPDGKDAFFQTLSKPSKLGATADINASTTLVTAAVVDGQADLGEFNAAKFQTATEATSKNLKPEAMPDFADRAKVLSAVQQMASTVQELKAAIDAIRQDLQDIKASLEQLKQQLASRPAGQMPPNGQPGMMPPNGQPGMMPANGQPGMMPPNGQPGMVPPNGQPGTIPPNGQPAEAKEHVFFLQGKFPQEDYPVKVAFKVPSQNQVIAILEFSGPDGRITAKVPEGLGHELMVKTARMTEPKPAPLAKPFLVPVGAPREVGLPLPVDGAQPPSDATGATPPTQQPSNNSQTANQTRQLSFKLPDGPFFTDAKYPLKVEFEVPPGPNGRRALTLTFDSAAGTASGAVPLGVGHNIIYSTADGIQKVVPNFVVPGDAKDPFVLPRIVN